MIRSRWCALLVVWLVAVGGAPGASAQAASAATTTSECALFVGDVAGGLLAGAFICGTTRLGDRGAVGPPALSDRVDACIVILEADAFTDQGCVFNTEGGYVMDPTLSTATVGFTVPSSVHGGGTLSASAELTGVGAPRPQTDGAPPLPPPDTWARLGLVRDATVSPGATVISSTVGGGPLEAGAEGSLFRDLGAALGIATRS